MKKFFIHLVEVEAWLHAIVIQGLRKTIEQCVIHFGYPKMHLPSHLSESIWQMGSSDNFTTDISEWLHIRNVKEAYPSTNKVNYVQQMLKHNDWWTGLDYMEETLSYLALQGCYEIDSETVFNLVLAANTRGNMHRAHLLLPHHCQTEPFFCSVIQQVNHLRETHVRGMCRSIKLTLLRDVSVDFGIPNSGQLFHTEIADDWGHEVNGLVLGCDQNVLIDSLFINFRMGCCTTVNHFTDLHLLSVWDLIAR